MQGTEAQVVRLYHLEGKSYQEISGGPVGMPEKQHRPHPDPCPPLACACANVDSAAG